MFDTGPALNDMAAQIRLCRATDKLTLQQLATRSGVAASTIHKIEAQQMVPTVSVLLKIAKGLSRRPEELIRDAAPQGEMSELGPNSASGLAIPQEAKPKLSVWHINLTANESLPSLTLDPLQRAIVLVEMGAIRLSAGGQNVAMSRGDCLAVEGGLLKSRDPQESPVRLTIVGAPPGDLARHLGSPDLSAAVTDQP